MTTTAKHMSLTITDEGEQARVTVIISGQEVEDHINSSAWVREQTELMERLNEFNVITGHMHKDSVKLELLVPKEALLKNKSIAEVAESLAECVIRKGWREECRVKTHRTVEYELVV